MERPTIEEQLRLLSSGTLEVIGLEDLAAKLRHSAKTNQPLIVKLGADPSAPDLHIGHAVVLRKLRQFQDLGHHVVFLIGDFTGQVGDPTLRSDSRRQLSAEEVAANGATYRQQVQRILDPDKTHLEFNSRWLAPLTFTEVLGLATHQTVARMLEREDFKLRFKENRPIYLHEFFYPLMQGYDSVALKADVELGGSDQRFNLLTARELMRDMGLAPEVVLLMPLLVGIDGHQKMSKSLGNQIGLDDPPEMMFGKAMSIPDLAVPEYLQLATDLTPDQVSLLLEEHRAGRLSARDLKEAMAHALVRLCHGEQAAKTAELEFRRVFRDKGAPADLVAVQISKSIDLSAFLVSLQAAKSLSEARRLVGQGAVTLDGERLTGTEQLGPQTTGVLRVGKHRFWKLG
ncbi:MAG: tyrosine--tRNA ligase [Sulfobacillus sp.]